jgi:threonine dehydrogenase-like Zn-dependent dehydrogenase
MITHRFAFRDYLQAYEAIEDLKGDSMKVMIEV